MPFEWPRVHDVVEEIWYVVAGEGDLWRHDGRNEACVPLRPGVSAVIPVGTKFQFRAGRSEQLVMLLATMPLWKEELAMEGPRAVDGVRRQNIPDKRARLLRDGSWFWPRPHGRPGTPFCDVAS